MTKVNVFPFKKGIYMVYSKGADSSKLFNCLYTQISPKNSLLYRILKSNIVLYIRSFFTINIDTPNNANDYIGIIKPNKSILFELEKNEPISVWKKSDDSSWEKDDFLGYQLISEYTVQEFEKQYFLIKKALKYHWDELNTDKTKVHGDFTHFNILFNKNNDLFFIDQKSNNHSKLFDFFYFYAYLEQGVLRNSSLGNNNKEIIINGIKQAIKEICRYETVEEFQNDFSNLNIPNLHGLFNLDLSIKCFKNIFEFKNEEL